MKQCVAYTHENASTTCSFVARLVNSQRIIMSNEVDARAHGISTGDERATRTDVVCISVVALLPIILYMVYKPEHNACVDYFIQWCAWEIGVGMFELCVLLIVFDVVVDYFTASSDKAIIKTD